MAKYEILLFMKYVIAYRHTNVPLEKLSALLVPVRDAFASKGDETYCTFFDQDTFESTNMTAREVMYHAFKKIEEMGALFILQDSDEKSEGMLMEVGYCIAKHIPIIVATREGVQNTYLPSMTDLTISYRDTTDLVEKISSLQY